MFIIGKPKSAVLGVLPCPKMANNSEQSQIPYL